jgi:hypothetical protein
MIYTLGYYTDTSSSYYDAVRQEACCVLVNIEMADELTLSHLDDTRTPIGAALTSATYALEGFGFGNSIRFYITDETNTLVFCMNDGFRMVPVEKQQRTYVLTAYITVRGGGIDTDDEKTQTSILRHLTDQLNHAHKQSLTSNAFEIVEHEVQYNLFQT